MLAQGRVTWAVSQKRIIIYPYRHFGSAQPGQLDQGETTRACASAVVISWLGQMGQLFTHITAREG